MGFFDRFRKNKQEELVEVINNKYCTKEDNFRYQYYFDPNTGGLFTFVYIGEEVIVGDKKLYKCSLNYGHNGKQLITDVMNSEELIGYNKVIVGIDKDRMNKDEKYAEFVLSKLLDRNRIKQLHDIEFGETEVNKSGNYVGTIIEDENGLSIQMDEEVMKQVANSPEVAVIHEKYERCMEEMNKIREKQDSEYEAKRIPQIDEQIKKLQEERESLLARSEERKQNKR